MRGAIVFICFAAVFCTAPIHAQSLLIRNVTVHPVSSSDIANGAVLIVDGKIEQVGPHIPAVSGARVIDGHGLQLYPGLINAATNVGLEEIESLRDTVDLDEIGTFNPELRAEVAFNPSSEHIPVTRAAGITSLVTLPGSGERNPRGGGSIISGQGALMHLDGWTWEQMAVKPSAVMDVLFPEVESVPPQLASYLNLTSRTFADRDRERKEQIRRFHEFLEQARQYQRAKSAAQGDFQRDIRLEAMLPVLEGKIPLLIRAEREQTIKDAIAFADEEKIKIILADPIEMGATGRMLKDRNIPVILGDTLRLPARDDDPYDAPYTLPNEFYKAGVKICFGTFDVQFARNLGFQAAQAAAFGLPREEALKAVTINCAQILGVADRIGSIETGKIADLILTNGDPLEATTSIQQMFIAGKPVSLESRHTREYQKWLARP